MHQDNSIRGTIVVTASTDLSLLLDQGEAVGEGGRLCFEVDVDGSDARFGAVVVKVNGSLVALDWLHVVDWEVDCVQDAT